MCMKIHCYFLLNINHGASQLYWGRPPNTTMRPRGRVRCLEVPGAGEGPLWGPREGASYSLVLALNGSRLLAVDRTNIESMTPWLCVWYSTVRPLHPVSFNSKTNLADLLAEYSQQTRHRDQCSQTLKHSAADHLGASDAQMITPIDQSINNQLIAHRHKVFIMRPSVVLILSNDKSAVILWTQYYISLETNDLRIIIHHKCYLLYRLRQTPKCTLKITPINLLVQQNISLLRPGIIIYYHFHFLSIQPIFPELLLSRRRRSTSPFPILPFPIT